MHRWASSLHGACSCGRVERPVPLQTWASFLEIASPRDCGRHGLSSILVHDQQPQGGVRERQPQLSAQTSSGEPPSVRSNALPCDATCAVGRPQDTEYRYDTTGKIVLSNFNHLSKVTPELFDIWMKAPNRCHICAGTGAHPIHIFTLTGAHRCHICAGTGAHRCHICAGTGAHPCRIYAGSGLTAAASAPGLGAPLPHLRRDWARRCS